MPIFLMVLLICASTDGTVQPGDSFIYFDNSNELYALNLRERSIREVPLTDSLAGGFLRRVPRPERRASNVFTVRTRDGRYLFLDLDPASPRIQRIIDSPVKLPKAIAFGSRIVCFSRDGWFLLDTGGGSVEALKGIPAPALTLSAELDMKAAQMLQSYDTGGFEFPHSFILGEDLYLVASYVFSGGGVGRADSSPIDTRVIRIDRRSASAQVVMGDLAEVLSVLKTEDERLFLMDEVFVTEYSRDEGKGVRFRHGIDLRTAFPGARHDDGYLIALSGGTPYIASFDRLEEPSSSEFKVFSLKKKTRCLYRSTGREEPVWLGASRRGLLGVFRLVSREGFFCIKEISFEGKTLRSRQLEGEPVEVVELSSGLAIKCSIESRAGWKIVCYDTEKGTVETIDHGLEPLGGT